MADDKLAEKDQALEKPEPTTKQELGIVQDKKGGYHLKIVEKKLEPWRVGVTESGEDVYAPVAGPNAHKALHLKMDVWVCRVCRATVHKREAIVDFDTNVYHRGCYNRAINDPKLQQQIKEREEAAALAARRFSALPGGRDDDQ